MKPRRRKFVRQFVVTTSARAVFAAGIPGDEQLKDDSREHLNIVFVGHVDAGDTALLPRSIPFLTALVQRQINDRWPSVGQYGHGRSENDRQVHARS